MSEETKNAAENGGQIASAEILCVGTELLLGDIVNTNAAYLSRELAALGIGVYHQSVVGDNPERLRRAMAESLERADLTVVTGGLGPTCDDITRETAAELLGRRLVRDPDIAAEIERYFTLTGRKMTENNLRQAAVPEGAYVLRNDRGTAPGLILSDGHGRHIAMMPGVPSEMVNMFEKQLRPWLLARSRGTIVSRNIGIFGIGESAVESVLKPLMDAGVNPTVAPYAKEGEVRLRVTAKADSKPNAAALCNEMIERIRATEVGEYIYGIDVGSIEAALVEKLRREGRTLSCAESCTGGLVAKRIVDLAGCSDVFVGGAVTYANEAKERLIGVKHETLERFGAVSAETAAEMAEGIRAALGTDVGISTTGIAGPGGGTPEKPVGTVFVAVATASGIKTKRLALSPMRDRDYIRYVSASHALHLALTEA